MPKKLTPKQKAEETIRNRSARRSIAGLKKVAVRTPTKVLIVDRSKKRKVGDGVIPHNSHTVMLKERINTPSSYGRKGHRRAAA